MGKFAKIEIYKSGLIRPSWKWRLKGLNGEIMASGRGLNTSVEARNSVRRVAKAFGGNTEKIIITQK